jgi:hypothetical protein
MLAVHCEEVGYNTGRKYCLQIREPLFIREKMRWQRDKEGRDGVHVTLRGDDSEDIGNNVTDLCFLLSQLQIQSDRIKRPKSLWTQSRLAARYLFRSLPFQVWTPPTNS